MLAVGDYNFERKCFAKIDEFRKSGGTILLVSHQLDLVKKIADRVVWLKNGVVVQDGSAEEVVAAYLAEDPANN